MEGMKKEGKPDRSAFFSEREGEKKREYTERNSEDNEIEEL